MTTGEVFHGDWCLCWPDLVFLAGCLVPGKCDITDEFGRNSDGILESSPLMCWNSGIISSGHGLEVVK